MKKRILASILSLIVIGTIFSGCGNQSEKSSSTADQPQNTQKEEKGLKKLNVGYIASTEHVLYFVAKEKGFFKDEGLDVELFLFANSAEGMNSIIAGKIDTGSFGISAINTFVTKGSDVAIYGGQGSEGAALITKPENAQQFKDLKDYKNKKIATVRLSTGDIVFKGALTEIGIDWKKDTAFSELDTPASVVEAVKKGTVDAGIVWSPYRTLAQNQGLEVVKQSGEVYKNHVCCMQVALKSKLNENPKVYESFDKGLIKAYNFLKNNKEETINIISKYVKIDKEVIEKEAYGTFIGNSPDPVKAEVERTWKLMNDAGFITSDVNIGTHINTSIYKNALDDILKQYPDDEVYKKLKADFKE